MHRSRHVSPETNPNHPPLLPLPGEFLRALSQAVFEVDSDDERAVQEFHASGGRTSLTADALEEKGFAYWARRTRRFVRPKAELIAALNGVLAQFSDCIDPVNGCALLTPRTSQVHEAVVELINSDSFCGAALGWRGVWHCGPTPRMLQAVSVRHGHAALCWTVVANRAPCQRPGF